MTRRRRVEREPDEVLADPRLPGAIHDGLKRGGRQSLRAAAWVMLGVGGKSGARAAESAIQVLETPTVFLPNPARPDIQVRVSLTRWKDWRLDIRTWFRARDGRWRPTRRGTTVPVAQLDELEEALRTLREARGQSNRSEPSGGSIPPEDGE